MRTIIIADLHNQTEWVNDFLATQGYDRVVFLGDYFDSAGDTPYEARRTALWLKQMLKDPRNVLLLGNHDLQYVFPRNEALRVPGFHPAKARAIMDILTPAEWARFRLFHLEQGFLLSHAGICRELFARPDGQITPQWLEQRCALALDRASRGESDPVLREGGGPTKGGITWLYWDALEPIPGWNQIVGHSYWPEVRMKKVEVGSVAISENYCLDCDCRVVGVLENGRFSWTSCMVGII